MTGRRTPVDDEYDIWENLMSNPEKYPWKQVGSKGLTIRTDCRLVPSWMEVNVCHVCNGKYGEYIVKLHNEQLNQKGILPQ